MVINTRAQRDIPDVVLRRVRPLRLAGTVAAAIVVLAISLIATRTFGGAPSAVPVYTVTEPAVPAITSSENESSLITPGVAGSYLLVLIGVVVALVVKKKSNAKRGMSSELSTVTVLKVGPSQHLRLVNCRGRELLLGISGNRIDVLQQFESSGATSIDIGDRKPIAPNKDLDFSRYLSPGNGRPVSA